MNGGRCVWERDAIRDGIRRDEGRDEIDTVARTAGACVLCRRLLLCGYISSLTIHCVLTFIHSSHHSYQCQSSFNSFKDFPRPPPACSPSSASLMLVPPPPGVGGAGVDNDCVAGVDNLSGRGYGVRFRSFALRLIRCSVMISGRRRWRLRRAAICVDDCGGSFSLLGLSFRRRGGWLLAVSHRLRMGCGVCSSCLVRVVSGRACLICLGVVSSVSIAYPCSYHASA